jgi:hypothetical protein
LQQYLTFQAIYNLLRAKNNLSISLENAESEPYLYEDKKTGSSMEFEPAYGLNDK